MSMQKKERRKIIVGLTAFILVMATGFIYKMFFDGTPPGMLRGQMP